MNFIERWLHVSPDAGTGATEMLWIVIPIFGAALIYGALRASKSKRERRRRQEI
jgi:hypothetical protein